MTSKSVFALVLVALLSAHHPTVSAEHLTTEFESPNANGHTVITEVHYHNLNVFPIPSVANKSQADSKYATTLVHFKDADGQRRFVISLAADGSLDPEKLRLVTKAKDDAFVPGLSFSVSSKPGNKTQLVTFLGRFTGDIRQLERLVVIQLNDNQGT